MANNRFITSGGDPYLAFSTDENIGNSFPGLGVTWLRMDVRVDRLPTQKSSANELHPIVSVANGGNGGPLLELGITPNGRFKCACYNGDVTQSQIGLISDTSRWWTVFVNYDFLGSAFQFYGDVTTFDVATLGQPIAPTGGINSKIMLWNGPLGLTNAKISLKKVQVMFDTQYSYGYRFGEKSGSTLAPTRDFGDILSDYLGLVPLVINSPTTILNLPASGVASAEAYSPVVPTWGTVPAAVPDFSWGLTTDYTRVAKPATVFTRVAS